MTFLQELKIFIKNILAWIFALVGFSIFFAVFALDKVKIFGKTLILPVLNKGSVSIQVFKIIERKFVPNGVQLIVTNPWSGFVAQLEIVVILSAIVTSPFLFYRIMRYCSPALFEHEKKAILKSVVLFTFLFALGCAFAYYFMIPLTFKFMYPFATSLGIVTFFSLDAFMAWVVAILITTGVIFLLPIFMYVVSYLGVVKPDFWKRKWRIAFILLLIFSAVITPDQTGVTMVILFIPLMILYMAGVFLAKRARPAAHNLPV